MHCFHICTKLGRTQTVAVETVVTHRPPHSSVRAELPHTAPTSGHDAKTFAMGRDEPVLREKGIGSLSVQNAAKTFVRADCVALTRAAMRESLPSGSHSA